jgi:hypothetical protein
MDTSLDAEMRDAERSAKQPMAVGFESRVERADSMSKLILLGARRCDDQKNARRPRFRAQFDMTISPIAPLGSKRQQQGLCDLVRCCAILCDPGLFLCRYPMIGPLRPPCANSRTNFTLGARARCHRIGPMFDACLAKVNLIRLGQPAVYPPLGRADF